MTDWKDTVMPLEYSALDGLHCAGISDEKILRALNKQAEISFRAGRKEVVECLKFPVGTFRIESKKFVDGEPNCVIFTMVDWDCLQAKLKEMEGI